MKHVFFQLQSILMESRQRVARSMLVEQHRPSFLPCVKSDCLLSYLGYAVFSSTSNRGTLPLNLYSSAERNMLTILLQKQVAAWLLQPRLVREWIKTFVVDPLEASD